jgi:hypothetical protein
MIISQLILSFKLKLDKIDSQAYPDILDQEIRFWIDEAADRFVKQRYERNNVKGKGFEETQKRTDDLRLTVRTETIAATVSLDYPGFVYEVPLPAEYRYLLKVQSEVRFLDCESLTDTEWSTPYQVQQDDIHALLQDPFNKPIVEKPLFTLEGNNIMFFTDGIFEVLNARISYIRTFDKLQPGLPRTSGAYATSTNEYVELAEDTHEEVVDMAVKMALENIESQRYQTNINEIRGQE